MLAFTRSKAHCANTMSRPLVFSAFIAVSVVMPVATSAAPTDEVLKVAAAVNENYEKAGAIEGYLVTSWLRSRGDAGDPTRSFVVEGRSFEFDVGVSGDARAKFLMAPDFAEYLLMNGEKPCDLSQWDGGKWSKYSFKRKELLLLTTAQGTSEAALHPSYWLSIQQGLRPVGLLETARELTVVRAEAAGTQEVQFRFINPRGNKMMLACSESQRMLPTRSVIYRSDGEPLVTSAVKYELDTDRNALVPIELRSVHTPDHRMVEAAPGLLFEGESVTTVASYEFIDADEFRKRRWVAPSDARIIDRVADGRGHHSTVRPIGSANPRSGAWGWRNMSLVAFNAIVLLVVVVYYLVRRRSA